MLVGHTTSVQRCIDQLQTNQVGSRDELIRITYDRLLAMVRGLMAHYPSLRRWEQSDDVLQNVQIRLVRCLNQMPIATARDFYNLAATNIRRELIDLTRHHYGVEGPGKNHATPLDMSDSHGRNEVEAVAVNEDPAVLAEWAELHEFVAQLPEDEREVMDLHWYNGLTQHEVASLLKVSVKTVKRRWMAAKARLAERLGKPISLSI